MLTQTNQLNIAELNELEQLKLISKKIDGNVPNLYVHLLSQPRALPTITRYYEKKQLLAFSSIYFFYKDAVEVALLVAPNARRKGIATQLIKHILSMVKEYHYEKLIFSTPACLHDDWLKKLGFSYLHSEYYMERHSLNPLLEQQKHLTFRTAIITDIPQLCLVDEACFYKTHTELASRFTQMLNDQNYTILLAFDKNQLVGKAHLRWQKQGATLSDIAVFPTLQGQGLGTALIAYCINYALSEGKPYINLDVETHNQKALSLYTRLGFSTQNACDYWEVSADALQKIMSYEEVSSISESHK